MLTTYMVLFPNKIEIGPFWCINSNLRVKMLSQVETPAL